MNKSKHTKGEAVQNGNNGVHTKGGECIALAYGENRKANAELIRDAFNVTNRTGLTPLQIEEKASRLEHLARTEAL